MAADWDIESATIQSIIGRVQTQTEKYADLFVEFGAEVSSIMEASKSQIIGEALVGLSEEKLQAAMTQVQGRSWCSTYRASSTSGGSGPSGRRCSATRHRTASRATESRSGA